jgi:hypothetical protein
MSLQWNGRNVEDALNKAAFAQVRDNVVARLRGARCPEHGRHPTRVTVSGRDLASLSWQVFGCCPKLREAAQRSLR